MRPKTQTVSLSGIVLDVVKDILFFPFWWYSFGLVKTAKNLKNFIIDRERSLGLFVWLKNIFTPMYGQRDWQGIMISIFIRIIQIIFRSIAMIFWLIIALALFWLWVLFPIAAVYEIIWQLFI